MDRCIIDGAIYTDWLYKKGNVKEWVWQYAWNLASLLIDKIDVIFYCAPDFDLVDDGVRSTDVEFRNDIIKAMETFIKYSCKEGQLVKLSGTVEQRMQTIQETLKQYGINPTR